VTTSYLYDVDDIARETQGSTTSTYVHGPGIDEPMARESGGSITYYHADGLGSIIKLTDNVGAAFHEYRYDAWGDIEIGTSTVNAAFTGREWDSEIALYYYRARYYAPTIGRFLSEDPIGFAVGPNFYQYALNWPTSLTDPFGLDAMTADPNIRQCLCMLWRDAGGGVWQTERAAWIMNNSGAYSCMRWPFSSDYKKEQWKGPVPKMAAGIAHTHPTRGIGGSRGGPRPSGGDEETAKKIKLPVYVVTEEGVWKYDPCTKKTTHEETDDPMKWCSGK
jgi:RHS repeat-associated protein